MNKLISKYPKELTLKSPSNILAYFVKIDNRSTHGSVFYECSVEGTTKSITLKQFTETKERLLKKQWEIIN